MKVVVTSFSSSIPTARWRKDVLCIDLGLLELELSYPEWHSICVAVELAEKRLQDVLNIERGEG